MIISRKSVIIFAYFSLTINCCGLIFSLDNLIGYNNAVKVYGLIQEDEDNYSKSLDNTFTNSKEADRVIEELNFRSMKIEKLNSAILNSYNFAARREKVSAIIWSLMLIMNTTLCVMINNKGFSGREVSANRTTY